MTGDLALARSILTGACGDRVHVRAPLAPLTTLRIGGPAALYLEPRDEADLDAVSDAVRRAGVDVLVIGKGSNLLVADAGFPGLVLRLGRAYRWASCEGPRMRAGAAMPLPALAGVALRHGLTGLEFGVAIPASVGGAVRMNAGAHGGQMVDVVRSVAVYRLGEGRAVDVTGEDAGFTYRGSSFPADSVIVGATMELAETDPAAIRARMESARDWRRRAQPLAEPNCGSVFKNPEGDHAARLIESAGLKGAKVGGVHVSEKHANFIVAAPGARAADVVALIRVVREGVAAAHGIDLEPEVHLVGEFPDA